MTARPATRGRLVLAVCFAALLTWRCGGWASSVVVTSRQAIHQGPTVEQRAALRGIRRGIDDGEHADMRRLFPEGGLFSLSFTGFAVAAMSRDTPELESDARPVLLDLLALSELEAAHGPFPAWGEGDWHGVIFEGHRNLLRAAYVAVGGDDPAVVDEYHRSSSDLAARFLAAPGGNLESYPGQVWPVDNVAALESLRLHDVQFGTTTGRAAIARWSREMRARVDATTGLLVSEIDVAGGVVRDGPRGCALSWMLAFLPMLDADLARDQWRTYRGGWSIDVAGMRGFREWPPGERGHVDADTGPIVGGIGAAASAFGVAAASANGDRDMFPRMVLPLEIATAPSFDWRGEKRLYGGHVLLADVLALWGRTWRPLDTPRRPLAASRPPLVPLAVAVALLLAPVAIGWVIVHRAWRARAHRGSRWVAGAHVLIALAALALDTTLLVPFIASACIDIAEARLTRRVVRRSVEMPFHDSESAAG